MHITGKRPGAVQEGPEGTECFVGLHGNRRTWVGCGRPGVPTGCAVKWPVWGVPLNDDDDDDDGHVNISPTKIIKLSRL